VAPARRTLAGRGIVPDDSEAAATSLHGLRDLVKRLARRADRLFAQDAAGAVGAVHVIYSRYQSVSQQVPTEERVLPPDLTQLRQAVPAPAGEFHRYLELPDLLAGLVSEYAFISLYRMAADSFASEQASRLLAMDGATRSTERMLQALTDLERRERQGEITRQVLELLAAHLTAE
jgi:F-type H+-transporting ATPase subunit gamma